MVPWLRGTHGFPALDRALTEPNGLLAAGGDLTPERLIAAYRRGIFPWYSEGQPILWWSPDPRMVLYPAELHVGRSLRKTLRKQSFEILCDCAFAQVIQGCAEPRNDRAGTWITAEMMAAYVRLNRLGVAHSVEAWRAGELVGGLYGIAIGRAFFGESMFSRINDASKVAFVHLVDFLRRNDFGIIDCQMRTELLSSFGAREIPRHRFAVQLEELVNYTVPMGRWPRTLRLADNNTDMDPTS